MPRPAVRADPAPFVGGAERVRRVFDHREAVGGGYRLDLIHIAGRSREVDGDHRLCRLRYRALDIFRHDIQSITVYIGKYRLRAREEYRVHRRREGHRRGDHLVSGADAQRHQRAVQSRGGGVDGERVTRAGVFRKIFLKLYRLRPHREPAAADRIGDIRDGLFADTRLGEGQKFFSHFVGSSL